MKKSAKEVIAETIYISNKNWLLSANSKLFDYMLQINKLTATDKNKIVSIINEANYRFPALKSSISAKKSTQASSLDIDSLKNVRNRFNSILKNKFNTKHVVFNGKWISPCLGHRYAKTLYNKLDRIKGHFPITPAIYEFKNFSIVIADTDQSKEMLYLALTTVNIL